MSLSIDPNSPTDPSLTDSDEAMFNAAVDRAGDSTPSDTGGLTDDQFTNLLVQGAVSVGAPMILMPIASDILNEGMSDD
jgi:hypothetical protein